MLYGCLIQTIAFLKFPRFSVKKPRFISNDNEQKRRKSGTFFDWESMNSYYWYLQAWQMALVPICRQDGGKAYEDCVDFTPSLGTNGLCFTSNGGKVDHMFFPSDYINNFKVIMLPDERHNDSTRSIKGSGTQNQYSFIVDANRYNDLRRGDNWNKAVNTKVKVGVHSANDVADLNSGGIEILPGYETTLTINFQQLYSDPSTRDINVTRRECKFANENDDLDIFAWYSRTNCLFECSMNVIQTECGCRPWDYPRPNTTRRNTDSDEVKICDFFANSCFISLMKVNFGEQKCRTKCQSDCNEIRYSIVLDRSPLDPVKENMCSSLMSRSRLGDRTLSGSMYKYFFKYGQHPSSQLNWSKGTPITKLISYVQDGLKHVNKSTPTNTTCIEKIMSDVALVHIKISNPTVIRFIQTKRVSFADQVANFGNLIYLKIFVLYLMNFNIVIISS